MSGFCKVLKKEIIIFEYSKQAYIDADADVKGEFAYELPLRAIDDAAARVVDQGAEYEQKHEQRLPAHVKNVACNQKNRPSRAQPQAEIERNRDGEEREIFERIEEQFSDRPAAIGVPTMMQGARNIFQPRRCSCVSDQRSSAAASANNPHRQ
jgi:hypothetical protein